MNNDVAPRYDVIIVGGGLAGLTLARHLLLETDNRVLLIEQRDHLPSKRQKVGESTVQVAGHYLGKVLELEEHLFLEHFMKYNLRFFWCADGRDGASYEDYGQSYIRTFSNIPSYQVDRNVLEAELLRLNGADPRFDLVLGARRFDVRLATGDEDHAVSFLHGDERTEIASRWVVDASGRNRVLAKRQGLKQSSEIRHGSSFLWVEGQVDLEKLTARSPREVRVDPSRRHLGHTPVWLATNHFCGEGFWLWVIPLRGKTSIGLVYDHDSIDPSTVSSSEKLIRWINETFPIFQPIFDQREVLDWWGFRSFSHDCSRTIHPQRWAITGEAGRFADPLYSPGSDLIAVYNTLIVDAMRTDADEMGARTPGQPTALESKANQAEALMRVVYEAYVPGYSLTYQTLGDQETYSLKYTWELTIYFGFYVFPFVNELLTERRFLSTYLNAFARLGSLNLRILNLLADFYQWKKDAGRLGTSDPCHFDFTSLGPLGKASGVFYQVGISVDDSKTVIRGALADLERLAQFIHVYVASRVVGSPDLVTNAAFVEQLSRLDTLAFDLDGWQRARAIAMEDDRQHAWWFDPQVLETLASSPGPVSAPSASVLATSPVGRSLVAATSEA